LVHDLVGTKVPIQGETVLAGHQVAGSSRAIRRAVASLISTPAIALAAVVLGAFAAPASAAVRSTSGAAPMVVPGSATVLSGTSLQALLASAHLGASTPTVPAVPLEKLEAPKLAGLLAGLTPINQLTGLPLPGLPPSTLGAAGLNASLQHAIEHAVAAGDTLGQVLSAKGLSTYLGESLMTTLGTAVEPAVTLLLKKTVEEVLAEGLATTSVTALTSSLLNEAARPTTLAETLVGAFDAATVQTRTGSLPAAAPVQSLTLEELATQLSLTRQALAEQLGAPTLPGSAPVTLSQLEGGHELALVRGAGGLIAGVLTNATEEAGPLEEVVEPIKETIEEEVTKPVEETIKGVGGGLEGLTGKGGGGGGTPSGTTTITNVAGSPGRTTVVLSSPPAPATGAGSHAAAATGKIKLISRHVKGAVATLVLSVPSAGRLKIVGNGVRAISRSLLRSQRVTVRVGLTKARAARLHAHRHRSVKVALRASFAPLSGAKSSVATRVALR
jgi:hypothetical protein